MPDVGTETVPQCDSFGEGKFGFRNRELVAISFVPLYNDNQIQRKPKLAKGEVSPLEPSQRGSLSLSKM